MEEFKSYVEWIRQDNRCVIRGQRANYFRTTPAMENGVAIFSHDQTEPINEPLGDVIVSAEDWKARKTTEPTIRVNHDPKYGVMVWCGNDSKAIEVLKKKGYTYHPGAHRWSHKDRSVDQVIEGWRGAKRKYKVVNEYVQAI